MTTRRKIVPLAVALAAMLAMAGCRGTSGDDVVADGGSDGATTTAGSDGGGASTGNSCPDSTPGLTDTSIKIGGSYPLSGPAAAYSSIPVGIDTWFKHLNETDGGLVLADGSVLEIEWSYLDDQYSPPKAVENAKKLVEQDQVTLILNPLGTGNNIAIRDYMNTEEVPQLFVSSGATTWGRDIDTYPWTIGIVPTYESEGIALAKYILDTNPDAKVGVLYQNDDFGKDNLDGLHEGMGDKIDQIVSEVTYEITDATIDNQISQIKDSGADAFVAFATPQFTIQSIQRKAALGWEPETFVISSVSASVGSVWIPAGPENGDGAVTAIYLKDPTDPNMDSDEAVNLYKELMAKYSPKANPDDGFNLFGMLVAQTFEALVEGIEGPVCRQSIMDAVKDFQFDGPLMLDGIEVKTGPGDAFPIEQVQLQRFNADAQTWELFGDVIDTSKDG